jgi:N utilization substance protein B
VQERVADALARMCDVEIEGDRRHGGGARPVVSTISRREARRAAVFMLFQWDVTGRPLGSLYEGEVDDYTRQLADAVTEHAAVLDARITSASDDWTADRLGAVERNVLRVALEELDEGEVPMEVVLDEAVTLAKRYASEDAARLVNGILGKLVREEQTK